MDRLLKECHSCCTELNKDNESDEAMLCKKCHIRILQGQKYYKCKMHNLICKVESKRLNLVLPIKEPEYIDDCNYLSYRRYLELVKEGDGYKLAKHKAGLDKSYLTMLDEE